MNKEYKKEIGKKRSYLTKKRWKNMELKQKKYIGKKISEEAKKRMSESAHKRADRKSSKERMIGNTYMLGKKHLIKLLKNLNFRATL
jgi:hypothetical protein